MNIEGLNEFLERNHYNKVTTENAHCFNIQNIDYYTVNCLDEVLSLYEYQSEFFIDDTDKKLITQH